MQLLRNLLVHKLAGPASLGIPHLGTSLSHEQDEPSFPLPLLFDSSLDPEATNIFSSSAELPCEKPFLLICGLV